MLLIGSAVAILFGTSAPIFGSSVDLSFYNQINLLIAVFMVPLIGFTLYSYWRNTPVNIFIKRIAVSASVSIIITFSLLYLTGIWDFLYGLLLFAVAFAIITNLELILKFNKNFIFMGGHIAHIGFGIFLIGALFSGVLSKSETLDLPKNNSQSVFNKKLTYLGNEPVENGKKYAFTVKIEDGNNTFLAKPIMYLSEYNNSLMREPDILIGAARDLYISPLSFQEGNDTGTKEIDLKKGEPYKTGNSEILFEKFDLPKDAMDKMVNKEPFDIRAMMKVTSNGVSKNFSIIVNDSLQNSFQIEEEGLTFTVAHFDVKGMIELNVMDSNNTNKGEIKADILSIEFREKPLINLVWSGVLLMSIGFLIMLIRRFREMRIE